MDCERVRRLLSSIKFQTDCAQQALAEGNSTFIYTLIKGIRLNADDVQDEIASATIPKSDRSWWR